MQRVKRLPIHFILVGILCCTYSYALALDDSQVKASFQEFQHDWLKRLKQHGKYGQENVRISEDPDQKGSYIATYEDLTEPLDSRVNKTDQKATPYVGVLQYDKLTHVCRGKTPEEARSGPFHRESEESITEIFRFSKGKWVY
jgi:hypothetical protein